PPLRRMRAAMRVSTGSSSTTRTRAACAGGGTGSGVGTSAPGPVIATGRSIRKVVPRSCAVSTLMPPPWALTTPKTTARPSPAPPFLGGPEGRERRGRARRIDPRPLVMKEAADVVPGGELVDRRLWRRPRRRPAGGVLDHAGLDAQGAALRHGL